MLLDLLKELVLELLRALLIEELCRRVKQVVARRARHRRLRRYQALLRRLHCRERERLLHSLTTGADKKL